MLPIFQYRRLLHSIRRHFRFSLFRHAAFSSSFGCRRLRRHFQLSLTFIDAPPLQIFSAAIAITPFSR
jgi:hypothetical protein